jgi:hypothetical protein
LQKPPDESYELLEAMDKASVALNTSLGSAMSFSGPSSVGNLAISSYSEQDELIPSHLAQSKSHGAKDKMRYSRDLVNTVRQMENIREWMEEYLLDLGHEEMSFSNSLNPRSNALEIAEQIKETLLIDTIQLRLRT